MAEEMKQWRWGIRTRFTFDEDQLGYRIADTSESREARYGWATIDCAQPPRVIATPRLPFLVLAMLSVFSLIGGLSIIDTFPIAGDVLLTIGFIFFVLLMVGRLAPIFRISFTDLAAPRGPIRIIADSQHDTILARIETAKRDFLRRTWAVLNLANDPNDEVQKFNWLLSNGIIDEQEHAQAMTRLQAARGIQALPDGTIN